MTGQITGPDEPNHTTTPTRDPNDLGAFFSAILRSPVFSRLGAAWLTYILFFGSRVPDVVDLGAPDKPRGWPQFLMLDAAYRSREMRTDLTKTKEK